MNTRPEGPETVKMSLIKRLSAPLLSVDPRSMALFRICLGLLAIVDVLRRWEYIGLFYSNEGVLANHYALYRPMARHVFSIFHMLSTPAEATVAFTLILISLIAFTVGWKTKFFQVVSLLGIVSLHSRNILLENGGDVVMNLMFTWSLFLPLGRRWSVDALTSSLKARKEHTPAELNTPVERDTRPVWSLACFAILWQLAVIYFFNTVHKNGGTWHEGSSIHYVLWQDRIATPIGVWGRDHIPYSLTQLLTWGTLVIEGLAPLLILSPFGVKWCRRIAVASLMGLHIGIALVANVGLFSWIMMVSFMFLLTAPDFALFGKLFTRFAGPKIHVFYDSDCGICHFLARVGRRMDVLGRITWVGHDLDGVALPPGYTREQLTEARMEMLIAYAPETGKVWTRHKAMGRAMRALPLGFLFAWPLWIPGLDQLAGAAYDAFARRRANVSTWLGFAACGLPRPQAEGPTEAQVEAAQVEASPPSRLLLGRLKGATANAIIATILVATFYQILTENRFVHKHLGRFQRPAWAGAVVEYGRLFQGWSMFAPQAPMDDGWLVFDLEMADGRRVDLQTGKEPQFVPANADLYTFDQFWGSYSMRIPFRGVYIHELKRWLTARVPHGVLSRNDRIKSGTVWWMHDKSPRPGQPFDPGTLQKRKVLDFKVGR